jgi:outer membrane cobalamin receptor
LCPTSNDEKILMMICPALLIAVFLPVSLQAAEENPQYPRMEEVVVVAAPSIDGNKTIASGGQVTVINKQQITDLNAQDIPSALRRTPGVVISRHNFVGSFGGAEGGAIYIRGMGNSRPGAEIQMLMDGVPRFAGVWSHPLMDMMSADIADSIEIYKGAQPILFGNMAFGAVNLITKRQTLEGFSTGGRAAFGSFNTWNEMLEHGGKTKNFDYYLLQSFKQSSGHREDAGGELQNYFARAAYQPSGNWSLGFTANASHNSAYDPGPEGRPQEKQGTYKMEDVLTIATLSHRFERIKGDIKVYLNEGKTSWINQYDPVSLFNFDTITDFDNYGLRARETLQPWRGATITAGADFDCTSGTVRIERPAPRPDGNFPRATFRIASPYLAFNQETELGGNWQIIPSAGVRYYNHSDFDSRWSGQAGFVLRHLATDLNVFYGKGINYPGLYVAAQSKLFWGDNQQWKNLDPETVDHLEAGVSRAFGNKIRANLTWFHDKGSNRLIIITSPAPVHYENIAAFETQGLEATLNFQPWKYLSLFAGGVWLYERSPDNLPFAPQWSATAGANLRLTDKIHLSLDTIYQDFQYVANNRLLNYGGASVVRVEGFWLLNGKISRTFTWPAPRLSGEIFLAGENLTNVSYAYKKDYPMPGVNAMLGVQLKF